MSEWHVQAFLVVLVHTSLVLIEARLTWSSVKIMLFCMSALSPILDS